MTTSDYELTDDQLGELDDNGFLVLRNRIPAIIVDRLREASDHWIAAGADPESVHATERDDYRRAGRGDEEMLFRIDYLHSKGHPASLELLGSPEVLGLAQSLAGPNFVPTYESLVFKDEDDGAPVYWHQDAVHPRNWRITNVDVYLDDSRSGQGALWVLPGSHRQAADVCGLERTLGWNVPGAVEVEMAAGDVLLHDVMVVHGSPPVRSNPLRRTVYYEFRAAEQIAAEGPWDAEWTDRRLRLVPLGLAAHHRLRPDVTPFEWRPDPRWRPADTGDEREQLRVAHLVHTRGSFCSAGDVVDARTVRSPL